MQKEEREIDPKQRAFWLAVRAGLLAVCKAIEKYIGIEEKKQ